MDDRFLIAGNSRTAPHNLVDYTTGNFGAGAAGWLGIKIIGMVMDDTISVHDLYDNSIAAYKTGTRQTVKLVTDTIRMAKRKEKVTAELQLRSDQSFQYTSSTYFGMTQAYGISPSMSRPGENRSPNKHLHIYRTDADMVYCV